MDNDFAINFEESLLGIRENVWSFTTKEKKETFSPLTTDILRLTSNGTVHKYLINYLKMNVTISLKLY